MNRRTTRFGAVASAVALTLAVSGCGREEQDPEAIPGVTDEACPEAVDDSKGCIYLGVLTDLTATFKGVGVPFTQAQKDFWAHVNENGGIGDYEVDIVTHVKDTKYDTDTHAQHYEEMKDEVLAIAQSLGTAHTNTILDDAEDEDIVVGPASLGSNWIFEDNALEVGTSYCTEAMNMVDHAVDNLEAKKVAVVHFPGDYGDDAMVGARIAAEERGIEFVNIATEPGAEKQGPVVAQLLREKPDAVVIATSPTEMAAVVGGAAQQGLQVPFLGSIPSWNALVLESPAAPAIQSLYMQASSFPTWESDAEGFAEMREVAGDMAPNDWYALGWAGSYVMQAVLEKAVEDGNLTREGVLEAATSLEGVDGKGTVPEGTANYAGEPNDAAVRVTQLNKVDPKTGSKVAVAVEPFTGPTAEGYEFSEPCYQMK